MAYFVAEADDDDELRLEKAIVALLAGMVERLLKVCIPPGSADSRFVANMNTRVCVLRQKPSDAEIAQIKALAWKYRRQMPREIAPKLPPHDPVVQEMERNR